MSAAAVIEREQARARRESLELAMLQQLRALRLASGLQREWRFCARGWRFDFAWPARMVALEVEGGTHSGGRHTRGTGYAQDCAKYNHAALLGWLVLRATTEQVKNGEAAGWVTQALRRQFAAQAAREASA